jgi:hypothetical protein
MFFANTAQFWYSLPLAVTVALVYSATRYEEFTSILLHAARSLLWTIVFVGSIFLLLWWLTVGL